MRDILDVLRAVDEQSERGRPMALATVVATTGSTYRGAGARLLVPDHGPSVGNISGGCLEGDVEATAREVMASGAQRLLRFDLTADEEAVWGWGLGCNGTVEVLIEPADRAAKIARTLRLAVEEERGVAAVAVLDSDVVGVDQGARLIVHPDGSTEQRLGDDAADAAAVVAGLSALARRETLTTSLATASGRMRVFVEALLPPPRLLVCGAGHDAVPVVELAARLGWRVAVVDDRDALLKKDRFPGAHRFVRVDRPQRAAAHAAHDDRSFVVVMSHNYIRDLDYLRSFLGTEVAYIGVLGPRRRLERLLDDLAKHGVQPSAEQLDRVFGPAGLDIGAEGPDEIAAAIVAELVAVHRGHGGGFLRERAVPIHERSSEGRPPAGNMSPGEHEDRRERVPEINVGGAP